MQVDLKDKWRNLERQNIVGPQDIGPQDPGPVAPDAGDAAGLMGHPDAALPPAPVDVGPQADMHGGDMHGAVPMMMDDHTAHLGGNPHMMGDAHLGGDAQQYGGDAHLGGDHHLGVPDLGPPDLSMHHQVHPDGMMHHDGMAPHGSMGQHDPHDPNLPMPDGLHNPEPVGVQ